MSVKKCSAKEARHMIDLGQVNIVDVRSQDTFEENHIPGAKHLNMSGMESFCLLSDKTKPVLVYCNHGLTSHSVAQHLTDAGFEEVFSLVGGFEAWQTQQATEE